MALSDSDQKKFFDHIRSKMKGPPKCPICPADDWALAGPFSTPAAGSGAPLSTIVMICKNCRCLYNFYWEG